MADYEGNVLLAPSYDRKVEVVPNEIMFSMVGLLQKGVTLLSGEGVLAEGTPLEFVAGSKTYKAATADANVEGFLRQAVDTGSSVSDPAKQGNIVLAGAIKTSAIPLAYATPDLTVAGLATTLGGRVNTRFGFLKF